MNVHIPHAPRALTSVPKHILWVHSMMKSVAAYGVPIGNAAGTASASSLAPLSARSPAVEPASVSTSVSTSVSASALYARSGMPTHNLGQKTYEAWQRHARLAQKAASDIKRSTERGSSPSRSLRSAELKRHAGVPCGSLQELPPLAKSTDMVAAHTVPVRAYEKSMHTGDVPLYQYAS